MKVQNLLICIALALFQQINAQSYEVHNSINFSNVNDGRDTPDGMTWYLPAPLNYGIYRTNGSWLAPNYQQLKLSFDTGIIIDGGSLYGRSGTFLQPNGGNVGIGTIAPDEKLTVKGKIHTQEVRVDMSGPLVPDYVFAEDYKLKSLEAVEDYIKGNKHLPEIPSATEIEKNGLMLAEMNMNLLKKVEELTLYMIEQQKKNKEQTTEIETLKKENQVIKLMLERISKLENQLKK